MPILPIIDLFILVGWTCLMVGAVLKAIDITTRYAPSIAGLTSMDFAVMAAICFGFALTLAARTWVKLNEPRLLAPRRRRAADEEPLEQEERGSAPQPPVRVAGADRP